MKSHLVLRESDSVYIIFERPWIGGRGLPRFRVSRLCPKSWEGSLNLHKSTECAMLARPYIYDKQKDYIV